MPPPPTIPKYFTILMTEIRDAIIFVGFWRNPPPQCPPLSPDSTMLNYINDREGGAITFCRILAPRPPRSPDATILNDFNDREKRGANIL